MPASFRVDGDINDSLIPYLIVDKAHLGFETNECMRQ